MPNLAARLDTQEIELNLTNVLSKTKVSYYTLSVFIFSVEKLVKNVNRDRRWSSIGDRALFYHAFRPFPLVFLILPKQKQIIRFRTLKK